MAKHKPLSAAEQARRRAQSDASAKPCSGSKFPSRGRLGMMLMGFCMDPLPSEVAGIVLKNDDEPAEAGNP